MSNTVYNYKHFKAKHYNFKKFNGPDLGEPAPDFAAYTVLGNKVALSDYFGKPIVLETGSITCPIYVGEIKAMKKIVREFPEVQFLVMYVREAHPGERTPAHRSLEHKIQCASKLSEKRNEERTVLIDDVDGTGHKLYGNFPNSVYVIDADGNVAWKSQWNRTEELRENLVRIWKGEKTIPPKKLLLDKPERITFSALFDGGFVALFDFLLNFPALVIHRMFKRVAFNKDPY